LAALNNRTACVRLLVDAGAAKEVADTDGRTALICAAHSGHVDCARLLVDGALDATDEAGCTALICAARKGHTDCARLLLDAGADTEVKDDGGLTALKWAQNSKKNEIAGMIAAHGAKGNAKLI
jgi:ankyrin repeat protein